MADAVSNLLTRIAGIIGPFQILHTSGDIFRETRLFPLGDQRFQRNGCHALGTKIEMDTFDFHVWTSRLPAAKQKALYAVALKFIFQGLAEVRQNGLVRSRQELRPLAPYTAARSFSILRVASNFEDSSRLKKKVGVQVSP